MYTVTICDHVQLKGLFHGSAFVPNAGYRFVFANWREGKNTLLADEGYLYNFSLNVYFSTL